jgi:polysaccharide biosynthesis protein PslH
MLRTLVVAPNLPYPAFSGVDLRNWQNINALKKFGRVGVFGLCARDARLSRFAPQDLEFYCTSRDPAITYPLPPGQKLAARAWLVDPLGHPNDFYFSEIASAELNNIFNEFKPQLVVLEGPWTHRYIELVRAYHCKVVFDLHDANFPLAQQLGQLHTENELPEKLARTLLPERVRLIEEHATAAVDQLWVCSQREAQLLTRLYQPAVPIHVVPNAVDVGHYAKPNGSSLRSTPASKNLVFSAMFAYPPNRVAAKFLIEEIFPRLVSMADDIRLVLAGSQPTAQMIDAARVEPRIVVTGPVPDIRPYLHDASALIVPLFHGSGTRIKILEAFAAAVPVISTPKGAEGLEVENQKHVLIAENADEFVAAAQRIWSDRDLVELLTSNGFELLKEKYSWEVVDRAVGSAVNDFGITA